LLGAGAWTLDGASLRIEVSGMGKKMLALTVNAAAEKIIRQELKRLGAPNRFMVFPAKGQRYRHRCLRPWPGAFKRPRWPIL